MPRVQQIKAAIGEARAPAAATPALDLLGRNVATHHLAQRPALGRDRGQQILLPRDRRTDFADDDAARDVGNPYREAQR